MNTSQHRSDQMSLIEQATLLHVGVLLFASSWVFGGNIWWMRTALALWASLSLPITLLALWQHGEMGRAARRRIWWLLPWLGMVALVGLSACNPSFRAMTAEGSPVLVNVGARWPNLPSCVNPAKTLGELWFYAGTYLSAFNLLLVPRHRRHLRKLLFAGVVNCLLLAVFGSMQKLLGAGYYFGAAASPNSRYFGTFIYNNHWGAFLTLWLGVTSGLLFHQASRASGRDLWHSPFSLLLVALLMLAATAPLSASRAATLLAALTLAIMTVHALTRIKAARQAHGESVWPPITVILLVVTISVGAIGWLAQRSIDERYVETRNVLVGKQPLWQGRLDLYRDTWTLAMRKPVFGWGLESFDSTFHLMRPRPLELSRQYESSYAEAHSDWLQSFAETGCAGTLLLALMGLVPLFGALWRANLTPLPAYLLLGCTLVSIYAAIEFPFANGAVVISFWTIFFACLRLGRGHPAAPTAVGTH
jgi:O-antigen ligase